MEREIMRMKKKKTRVVRRGERAGGKAGDELRQHVVGWKTVN